MQRIDDWMETASGVRFHFLNPSPEQVVLEDVALALSRACRYGGHTRRFYSVAEHCCLMSDWVLEQPWGDPMKALVALHHDDAEAYIGDLPRPAKQNMPQFKAVEERIDEAVARRFGLEYPHPAWLKDVDTRILVDERAAVMRRSGNAWSIDGQLPLGVRPWNLMGRWTWWVRSEWLWRHHRLVAMIDGTEALDA